ncbi:helix-turn-helix domain-containing protein [Marinicella meishanensis]|uniref:helix-turn-helix domain-containing protein n=1 Tax=Marinicella meishanensis TaxID=2873263 RepID=UPI001CC06910|nr:helix-turn-helix domain-containing protein [Marinicella sp. NBU2979]
MIVKKLRLQRSWSQEQLAEYSGLSIRTIQRIEKGKPAQMESFQSIAAVFEVNVEDLQPEIAMQQNQQPPADQKAPLITDEETEAMEYVQGLKSFYVHAMVFVVINTFILLVNLLTSPGNLWFFWATLGWGLGLAMHAMVTFDWLGRFDSEWEKKQIEKRLGRKL